jgi:endonuclease/exonuclease/phosphatase (EEP) superfamily protein YafD
MKFLNGLAASLLRLALLSVAAFTLLPLAWRLVPRLVIFQAFAPQLAAVGLLLVVLNLLFRSRGTAFIGAVAVAWNLVLLWPELTFTPRAAVAAAPLGPALKVMTYNIFEANHDAEGTRAMLAASGADVIGLMELRPDMKAALAPLREIYPYSIDCVGVDPACAIMLLSKYPLRDAYAGRIDGRFPFIAEGEIDWNGAPVAITVTHLSWPFMEPGDPEVDAITRPQVEPVFPGVPRLSQSLQAANLAAYLNKRPADLVLMGDFNAPSWSAMLGAFRAATGLENRGHLQLSWPAWSWPILRLPIDHVFVRGKPSIARVETGNAAGSDHLPLLAEITVRP